MLEDTNFQAWSYLRKGFLRRQGCEEELLMDCILSAFMCMNLVGRLPSVKPWYDDLWQVPDNFMSMGSERHWIWRSIKSHSQNAKCLKLSNFQLNPYMFLYNKHSLRSQNTPIQNSLSFSCLSIYLSYEHKNMCLLCSIWGSTWCLSGWMWYIINTKYEAEQETGDDGGQRVRRERIRTDILCL